MDINSLSLSSSMANSTNLTQVGMAMLGKQLDTFTASGEAMVASLDSMPSPSLESMVNPSVGQHIDMTV